MLPLKGEGGKLLWRKFATEWILHFSEVHGIFTMLSDSQWGTYQLVWFWSPGHITSCSSIKVSFTIKNTIDFFIKRSLMWELNWIGTPSSSGTVNRSFSKVQLGFIYENLSGNGRKVESYTKGHFIDCRIELFLVKHLNKNHISSLHSITVCKV